MKPADLVYIGIKGSVLALDRNSGTIIWRAALVGSDFVNLVGAGKNIFATTKGEVFCLDSQSGAVLWHNRLKGLGIGLASLLVGAAPSGQQAALLVAKHRHDQQAAAATSASAAS